MGTTIALKQERVELLTFYELPEEVQGDFTYIGDPDDPDTDVGYRFFQDWQGEWQDTYEFGRAPLNLREAGWDGIRVDSFFSGILIRWVEDCEFVDVALITM